MIAEVAHFVRHWPSTFLLRRRLDRAEAHAVLSKRLDAAGMAARRDALASGLDGRILEIGPGTGAQFRHYRPGAVVTAIEPDGSLGALALREAGRAAARITTLSGHAERLPFDPESFDAIVMTMVLCCVRSVEDVLEETARVLRTGGELRFIEHVPSDRPIARALMELLNPLWRASSGSGCNINRDPLALLRGSGFLVLQEDSFQLFCPGFPAFPFKLVRARRVRMTEEGAAPGRSSVERRKRA